MYIPNYFSQTDQAALLSIMRRHGFATLVTTGELDLLATHVPILASYLPASDVPIDLNCAAGGDKARQSTSETDPTRALVLRGHLARANPHARLADKQRGLVIFQGPHAYISPSWYEVDNAVPTWNYVAVHASGHVRIIQDRDWLFHLLRDMAVAYEAAGPDAWSLDRPDAQYLEGQVRGIVGFEMVVDRLEGKWKLSQNQPEARRQRVIARLDTEGASENERAVAELMREVSQRAPDSGPDYSRRPEQGCANGCRNSANASNAVLGLCGTQDGFPRPKFRKNLRLLGPAYTAVNDPD